MTTTTNLPNKIEPEFLKRIMHDRKVMIALTKRSLLFFFYVYFGSYIKYSIAPFHYEMFKLAQDESIKRVGVVAFRDSAKSTIMNTAYSLWAIMGVLKKKHIVIASQTQPRVYDHLRNIRREIEKNRLLRQYLGPFEENRDQWNAAVLTIPRYDARITAISVEEGIRGLREGPHRPDLIIVDDIEDLSSVKTKEGRDKIFNWLTGELLPLGDLNTKVVFIGNFLHEDSALMRIHKMMAEKEMDGIFLKIPLLDEKKNIAWLGKFPSFDEVEKFKRSLGNEIAWQREYLLKYVPEANQVIRPEDIHYYDVKPQGDYWSDGEMVKVMKGPKGTGIDLAISQKEAGDFTAMVSGEIVFLNEVPKIYINPFPLKAHLDFHQTIEQAKTIHRTQGGSHQFYVENVAYQQAAIQEFERNFLPVTPMQPSQDKRSRLQVSANYIKNGTVLFPKKGCEELIQQLIYFDIESHDDLADALVYLILGIVNTGEMDRPDLRVIAIG